MTKKKPITPYEDLTVRQQRFVDYYDGNATQAAEKAGYSHAGTQGQRLLHNVAIINSLREREVHRRSKQIMSRRERQTFWSKVARGEEVVKVVTGMDAEGFPQVEEVPWKPQERLKASELLARSEADFTDKVALGGVDKDEDIKGIELIFVAPKPRQIEKRPEPKLVTSQPSKDYDWGGP